MRGQLWPEQHHSGHTRIFSPVLMRSQLQTVAGPTWGWDCDWDLWRCWWRRLGWWYSPLNQRLTSFDLLKRVHNWSNDSVHSDGCRTPGLVTIRGSLFYSPLGWIIMWAPPRGMCVRKITRVLLSWDYVGIFSNLGVFLSHIIGRIF